MSYFTYENKNIYYEEIGSGFPLMLLHGNSVSSSMFTGIIHLYKDDFKLILIDFLGHGKSDRLEEFPTDFWYDQAKQVIRLLTLKGYKKVNIIGTSGGALTAINVGLERGDLINKLIADSLEGEASMSAWTSTIRADREQSKSLELMRMLWEYCHGEDWEHVIDQDTDVILRHDKTIKKFFHKDLSTITVPVKLTASLEDDALAPIMNIEQTYKGLLKKLPNGNLHLFPSGGHPAMLTNAEAFADMAKEFFKG